MANIIVLQHVSFEGPASIADWASDKGHNLIIGPLYKNPDAFLALFQSLDTALKNSEPSLIVVLGGPMNVDETDKHSWLGYEKDWITRKMEAGHALLGICLGAQLIAQCLGASVYRGPAREIGWFPVDFSENRSQTLLSNIPDSLKVLHWHGDTFDLPEGAIRLAGSAAVQNQAFQYKDRVLALQFHLETNHASLKELANACSHELKQKENELYVSTYEALFQSDSYIEENIRHLYGILDKMPLLS